MGDVDTVRGGGDTDIGGPGSQYQVFVENENLLDKLKLLEYERSFCTSQGFKPFSRYHYGSSTGVHLFLVS